MRTLCRSEQGSERCLAVEAQWRAYVAEQRERPGWHEYTRCIEAGLFVVDLRSPAARCLMCNWFAEYARFSERDQLGFAYVTYAMGFMPAAAAAADPDANASSSSKAARLVRLLPRTMHWSVNLKADTRDRYRGATPFAIAKRVGHTFN